MMPDEFGAMLDRRFDDFEKVMDARLGSIEKGLESMNSVFATVTNQVTNMHKEYVPRTEIEAMMRAQNKQITELQQDVKKLTAWRNYLAGGIAIIMFALGLLAPHIGK